MGFFSDLRTSIVSVMTAEVMQSKLELAAMRGEQLESEKLALEKKMAVLEFQLAECQRQSHQDRTELEGLKRSLEETVRIARGIEFRRGLRTGNTWQAFCSVCHAPAVSERVGPDRTNLACSSGICQWFTDVRPSDLPGLISTLT